jgi:hypothetical protein
MPFVEAARIRLDGSLTLRLFSHPSLKLAEKF